jgi:List-Bact-rpt repeat protein
MRRALPLRLIAAGVVTVALTAVAGVSAQPVAKLKLRVTTDGNGTLSSGDRRIACGSRCSARYRRGTLVSLQATPARFFAFDHWSGGCVGTSPRCFVVVDASKTVNAAFVRTTARLSLAVGGPGTVASTPQGISCGKDDDRCSAEFPAGTTVTLTPTPASGGIFGIWTGPCAGAAQGPCTLAVDGDVQVMAAFRHTDPDPDQPLLTVIPQGVKVTSEPAGINCPPTCQVEFPSGTLVTLRGIVSKWNGACVGSLGSCLVILDNSDGVGTGGPPPPPPPRQFGVNISVSGPGMVSGQGGIRCGRTTLFECEGLFAEGATIVLRAKPGRRGRFVFWRGFCVGKKRTCSLRVTAPKTVQALFRR